MSQDDIDVNTLGEKIVRVLKTIFDPEIPVDIYELGLIYDVFVNEDYEVKILMTLTTPNCPSTGNKNGQMEDFQYRGLMRQPLRWNQNHLPCIRV